MHVSDATLRRAAWAMPVVYACLGVPALALAVANGLLLGIDLALVPVFFLYTMVGALVALRQPRNPVGWLLSLAGLFATISFLSDEYAVYETVTAPGTLPASGLAVWLSLWVWMGMLASLLYTVLLFPSGRLPSPRWRPVSWTAAIVLGLVTATFAFGTPASDAAVPIANPSGSRRSRRSTTSPRTASSYSSRCSASLSWPSSCASGAPGASSASS